MNKKMQRRERGYSLAEVMVATAIFAIIILAALTIYDRSNRVFKRGVESSNMQQNTRVAFEKVAADLRMAGFDFDRDGIPTGSTGGTNQYQQTDEQFEYIGPAAITVRANFDYESENQPCTPTLTENCDNGREGTDPDPTKSYESSHFPVVTTGNDEIVTYALVPDSQNSIPACNTSTNCVQFYADTHLPRSSYPGGQNENVVQIPGVDLCNGGCNNPPYTLYRFTLDRAQSDFSTGANVIRTPLASNIRSIQFTYFQDAQGTDPLKDLANTTDVSTGATIGGSGQWVANNPGALVVNREIRSKINSLRFVLIGMNEQADPGYKDATETLASMQNFRKYRLETLIAPRNIQKRGMREQDTFPPGAPTNVTLCTGYCGGVRISWQAPAINGSQGAPDQYKIIFGPTTGAGWPCETTTFTNTWAYVFGSTACGPLDPSVQYKFSVVAMNSYGSSPSLPDPISGLYPEATPLNSTQMAAPTWVSSPLVAATNNLNGKVTLQWNRPTTLANGAYSCPTYPDVPAGEIYGYLVERSLDGTSGWSTVKPIVVAGKPTVSTTNQYDLVTFDDDTVPNCQPYYYRVTAIELCAANAAYNVGGTTSNGSSAASGNTTGQAQSNAAPATPGLNPLTGDTAPPTGDCDASGLCRPTITWPKVATDTAGNPITVAKYQVYRQDPPSTIWQTDTFVDMTATGVPAGAAPVTTKGQYVSVAPGVSHNYRITALQCGLESTVSPQRTWPCAIPPGLVGTPPIDVLNAFDGAGNTAFPWLVDASANIRTNINAAMLAQVAYVKYRVYDQTGTLKDQSAQITSSPYSWTWSVGTNALEHVTATIVTTLGCSTQVDGWVQDEPQGCCIETFANDSTIMSFSAGNSFVDFTLRNLCSNPLTINSVAIHWDTNKVPSGGKLSGVIFPLTAGGTSTVPFNTTSGSITATAPLGTKAVPVNSGNTYKIRVTFTKTLSQNPFTLSTPNFTPNYSTPDPNGGTNTQNCDIK